MVITARAIGVLEEILINPQHGGAMGMSARFGEGRDAIQSTITLLKKVGFVETIDNRLSNGRLVRTLRVTEAGNQFLETRTYILQSKLNPNNNLLLDINTDLLSHKPNRKAEEKMSWDDFAPMYIDPEDREEYRQKQRDKKHRDRVEFHEKRDQQRMKHRDENNPASWTATDSAFEFADRMHRLWHVAPWKVTQSRFIFALDNKRSEYNTNGALEQQMMEIYFNKIKHDTSISDPEKIWKKFIVEFQTLLIQVQRESATPEQLENERERSKKSRSQLRVQE